MSAGRMLMVIDAVDKNDRVIGTVPRGSAFTAGVAFRVVHGLLFNSAGGLLLQRIADGLRHGGYWGSSVAGYLLSGETYEQAIARKFHEELALSNLVLTDHGKTMMDDSGSTKFIRVFSARHDGPFTPNPNDAKGVAFMSLRQVDSARHHGAQKFTPTFQHVIDFYLGRIP